MIDDMQPTAHKCPTCGHRVVLAKWTNVTHADHAGRPVETTSHGLICSNDKCDRFVEPFDDREFDA